MKLGEMVTLGQCVPGDLLDDGNAILEVVRSGDVMASFSPNTCCLRTRHVFKHTKGYSWPNGTVISNIGGDPKFLYVGRCKEKARRLIQLVEEEAEKRGL